MAALRPLPRRSYALLIASLVLTAIMVHPSLASLLAMALNFGVLLALRFAAWREGVRDGRAASSKGAI